MSYNFISIHINTLNRWDVDWRRHELYNSIKKLLNTLVTISTTTAYRNSGTIAATLTKSSLQILNSDLLALKVLHHQIIIKLADLLDQLSMILFCLLFHILWDIANGDIITLLIIVDICLHFEQVDDSLEIIFLTDWKLKNDCVLS